MKKYLLYIILTFLSFIPILKVKASTTTELYVTRVGDLNNVMEWVYNNANDYLLNLKTDYTSYSYYFSRSVVNQSLQRYSIMLEVFLFDNTAYWQNLYQTNATGFKGLRTTAPITKYIVYAFYWDNINKKVYTDSNFTNEIFTITDNEKFMEYENTSNTDRRNIFSTSSSGSTLEAYGMYFTNMEIQNLSNSRSLVLREYNSSIPAWESVLTTNVGEIPFSFISIEHDVPNYLTGYKPITITPQNRNTALSGLQIGSVFIPYEAYQQQHGTLGYFDIDLKYQPYTSIIEDIYLMPDNLYYRQDFDLSTCPNCEFVTFYKYLYYEGEDTLTYTIYVPNSSYDSTIVGTLDEQNGKYDYSVDYKDSNGDIQNATFSGLESELLKKSPLLGQIFSDFSTDTFGITSIITAPLVLIQQLSSSTCTQLNIPLPYVNSTLPLPCMSSIYSQYFGDFYSMYQEITFGIIAYWVIVRIFNLIKDFKNPEHDEIEVLDL